MHFPDLLDFNLVAMTVCHPFFNTLVLNVMFVTVLALSPYICFHMSVCVFIFQYVQLNSQVLFYRRQPSVPKVRHLLSGLASI